MRRTEAAAFFVRLVSASRFGSGGVRVDRACGGLHGLRHIQLRREDTQPGLHLLRVGVRSQRGQEDDPAAHDPVGPAVRSPAGSCDVWDELAGAEQDGGDAHAGGHGGRHHGGAGGRRAAERPNAEQKLAEEIQKTLLLQNKASPVVLLHQLINDQRRR